MKEMIRAHRLGGWLKRRGPRLLGELLLLLVIALAAEWFLTRDAARGTAPVFSARTVTGESFDLRQLQGQPSMVYFWATWCPVCNIEKGTIDALAEEYPVITVAMQSGGADAVRDHMDEAGVSFPAIADPEGKLSRDYGVTGVPAFFILDSEGEVAFVARGYTTGAGLRLRLMLADLFK
ncbi:protein disulfide oxidoreductase [Thiohalomonas denitrificans]|uniref:Peroxiredoxin n=1 Tax=Thiohalomonas denitrificans TaxID=415747 RepID=A0A1G5PQR2_9GAMM|nr:protein disulfide oxidoreductase [Thiohalomonas denitrificans]SCZ51767.1 Peroxiredoxin [Thiohalomonas denitrificans]